MTKPLVFTRYLYSKEQVYHSLIIALLEKAIDEALFWTYELYFSGFQEELYVFVESVYDLFYKSSNSPALQKCIEKFHEKWLKDQINDYLKPINIIYPNKDCGYSQPATNLLWLFFPSE
jgi:hypothetical protein